MLAVMCLRSSRSPSKTTSLDIKPEQVFEFVRAGAEVVKLYKPKADSKSPYKLFFENSKGLIPLVLWKDQWEKLGFEDKVKAGTKVYFVAQVSEYKGKLQLAVSSPENVSLEAVPESDLGKEVTWEGTIVSLNALKKSIEIDLKMGKKKEKVFFPKEMVKHLPLRDMKKGVNLKVTGTIKEFKGKMELVPNKPDDVVIVK